MRGLLLLAVLVLPVPGFAQMYKCVDEHGKTHYTDGPRPGCKGAQVDIKPSPRVGTASPAPSGTLKQQEADFQRRRIKREREEEQAAAKRAAIQRRCDSLRADLERASRTRVARLQSQIDRECR